MNGAPSPGRGPGSVDEPRTLKAEEPNATIEFQRLLHHPIEEVWTAITDPAEVAAWFMVQLDRPPTSGSISMRYSNGLHATGRVLDWDPPHVYEYEWNIAPGPTLPRGEQSVVRWELTAIEGGTLLVVTHRKLTRHTAEVFSRGFSSFLDRLSAQMDRRPLPEPPWLSSGSRVSRSEPDP